MKGPRRREWRLVHREERRLQYVAVGGVAIGGGRWRVTTVRGSNGAAVVRVGGRGASGKRGEVQKPLGEFEGSRVSAARAAQSDICAEIARGMRCSGLSYACAFNGRGRRGRGRRGAAGRRAPTDTAICFRKFGHDLRTRVRSWRLVHRVERRLQYGVAIGGDRWRVTTVRGRTGAAVVRVGAGMRVGRVRYGEQRNRWARLPVGARAEPRVSPLRAQHRATSVLNARVACDAAGSRRTHTRARRRGGGSKGKGGALPLDVDTGRKCRK